ncbi:LysE/ArgO family amino acid transporter [Nocardioides sp. Soil805]|uniref:LysE/ArgO family amino acid transporter n=1 Tax=Nocardioides sp. Soil805 TaxID=1736416 RepID=UPI000703A898|nr:LysE/ArgO family amino acid transporter [Nocardioides sp. Soil805]KRF35139.1 amino acid transporter [Nocardioides sp. Soil805]
MLTTVLAGLLAGLSLIVAIGAQNAFVLRQGIRREHVGAVALLCSCADAALILAGVTGIGTIVERAPVVLDVVRWAGAAFLMAYAVLALRRAVRPGELHAATGGARVGLRPVLTTAAALTFLNPHVYLDTVLLLGSLANQHGDDGRWAFALGAVLGSFLWFFGLAYGARRLAPLFARPSAWRVLDGLIAVIMAAIALSLVLGG